MVKRVPKAKSTAAKPTTSKKSSAKSKSESLSNGLKGSKNEDIESKSEVKKVESEIDESSEEMNTAKNNTTSEEVESTEIKASTSSGTVNVPRKQKRKAVEDIKKKSIQTNVKKQKVDIQIPKILGVIGKVFVIGENDVGQLGLEDDESREKPELLDLPYSIVDIAAGGMHSVCLTEKGEVITFGCNDEGALGRITSDETAERIPQKVDIPERIVQISAGDSHSAALSEAGQVYIWGNFRNGEGPMGLIAVDAKQPIPVKILRDVTVVKISSGVDHIVCLSREGIVYTCGCASQGQLGRIPERAATDGGRKGKSLLLTPDKVPVSNSHKNIVDNIWTGSFTTYVKLKGNGEIYAFGLNNDDQLGIKRTSHDVVVWKPRKVSSFNNKEWVQIIGGQHHTLSLDINGLVYSVGCSTYGRLGLGENLESKVSVPTSIPTLQDRKCVDISCGNCVSFAVTDNGSAFSWGMGTNYQLGHGGDSDEQVPRLIEGDFFNSWKAIKIAGGGQHTLILAQARENSEETK